MTYLQRAGQNRRAEEYKPVNRVVVDPRMIRWARERAGRSVESLRSGFPKLAEWESGTAQPTLKQLEGFAKAVHVPVSYLFLREPPDEPVPIQDFRTRSNKPLNHPSPGLLDTVYLCQHRQDWYREYARLVGETPLTFVGSAHVGDDVADAASAMRKALGIDLDASRRMRTWAEALRIFIEQADSLGVLVIASRVADCNNRCKLDPGEFRGFALADRLAPLVFINGADTKAEQIYTLAHNLAHIWLGNTAISDASPAEITKRTVDRWCSLVATDLLVPIDLFQCKLNRRAGLRDEIDRLARYFKVSTLVILRRMHDVGILPDDAYWKSYADEVDRMRRSTSKSGGNSRHLINTQVSKRLARALVESTLEGRTPRTEAFRLLGIKKTATFKKLCTELEIGF